VAHDGEVRRNDQGVPCRWDDAHKKWVQADTALPDNDDVPEYMTLEDDGQEAFDAMWLAGATVTEDGYRR
jgi:hypothetical protein